MQGDTRIYYKAKNMDIPTMQMYGISKEKVLLIGTAKKQEWAISIDNDNNSPADIIYDGIHIPFKNKEFDICILDFTTNFTKPSNVNNLINEANRVGKKVMGRCHYSPIGRTLKGVKQAYCHKEIPQNVEWVEIRNHDIGKEIK